MPIPSRGNLRRRAMPVSLVNGMALLFTGATMWFSTAAVAAENDVAVDDLQRSLQLDNYKVVANSGAGRGENIYFYKCWMCHNQYAKSAPLLKDLYQRQKLLTGAPVNDDSVTAKIK